MMNMQKNAITIKRALLIFAIIVFVVACFAGCGAAADTGDKTEGMAESSLRDQLANDKVKEIAVKKDLVLEAPVEVNGTKVIYGGGSITAVGDGWTEEDYMFVVSSGAQLTVKGSVSIDAAGVAGGVHAEQGAVWSIEETASVKNASAETANTLVEGKFLMNGGTLADAMGHNVYNMGEVTISEGEIVGSGAKFAGIYNEGNLTQNGGTIREAYNNVAVLSGSFTFNGGNNQDSIHDGIYIAESSKLSVTSKEAAITGSGVRGIYLCGEATIDGISLNSSEDSLVKISKSGTLNLKGGTLADSGYHSVENAGKLVVSGGTIRNSYNCAIVNTGTLEMTGGSILDNVKNKGVLNKHNGQATITGTMFSGNRFAVANEDTAVMDLTKAEILLTTGTNVYAYDGTVNIHDIALGASNSNNVRIYKADVTMTNVQVLGNSSSGSGTTHGILLEGGTLKATDITIKNVTGYGIRNKGGQVTAENLLISKSTKAGGIHNADQDFTGRPGNLTVNNLTIEECRYNNVVVDGGTMTVINGKLDASGTNNVKVTGGVLNMKDVDILGNQEGVDGTNHVVYSTGGTIEAENVVIKNAKVNCLRMNGETAVFNGKNVVIEKSGANKYGIDISKGQINIDGLTMTDNHYNIVNNGGNIKLSNATLGPTNSNNVRVNKGSIDLRNVKVNGHTPNHVKSVHALFVDGGTLTGNGVTVRNVSDVGLRVKKGSVNLTKLTVNDSGKDAVWISDGKATLNDLVVKKAGGAGVSLTDTGKATVNGGSINNTVSHGAKSEQKATLTLKNITVSIATTDGRHAVLAQGGDIHLENVEITGLEKNTAGFGVRINRDTSHVSGKGVSIADVNTGISATAGTCDISGVTTENISQHSAYASTAAKLVISDSEFGASGTNNAKAENGGSLTLNNTVINGTVKNHGVMVEKGGYFYGKDLTVRDTAGSAVRVKCSDEGNYVEIDGLITENIGVHNVYINKDENAANIGSVAIKNADLCRTGDHSVQVEAGNVTLIDTKLQGHLEGTANNIHTIYICKSADKVKLEGVDILDSAGDALRIAAGEVQSTDFTSAKTGRYGIWADGGKLIAENTTISNSGIGVYVTGKGAMELNGVQISNSGLNSISVSGAELTVNGYADGTKSQIGTSEKDNVVATKQGVIRLNNVDVQKSAANNIVTTGGKIYVTDATITGGDYSVLAQEAGYAQLTNVTITDPVKDGIRVNAADGEVAANNVQIVNPVRYGISAQKGSVGVTGNLTITSDAKKSSAIYVYDSGKVTTETGAAVNISGTEHGISVENATATLGNVTISDCAKNGVKVVSGTAVINGINVSGSGSNNVLVSGGELAVNGYADSSKSQIGTCAEDNIRASGEGVIRLNKVSVGASVKNGVVAIDGGTIYMADSSVTGSGHSVLAQDGKVYLNNISIHNSATSGIRVNKTTSVVEATGVTIEGAAKGLSVQYGAVEITDLTVRNTTGIGVSVESADVANGTNVTINNLVAENCGTNAIKTSGANASLFVNGATLGSDGSDHVIDLNGGPLTLNDVAINGANLATGKYELYSGAGFLTIGGAMDANVYIATGRVIKVNKELTGNNLVVDWKTAPTGNALEFADEAMMNASKDNIRLGATQTAANACLYYYSRYAKLVSMIVTNETELKEYLEYAVAQNMSDVTVLIGDSFNVANQVAIPASITKLTIQDDGDSATTNTITYTGSTDGLFAMRSDLELTVEGIGLGSTNKVLLKQTAGTTVLEGVALSGSTTNIYVTGGTMTVNGGRIEKSSADSVKAENTGVIALNGVDVLGSSANGVVAINGGKISMTDSSVTGGGHSVLAQDGEVTLSNVTIRNSTNSGIRVNRAGSVVNATGVTIEGANTGLSISLGNVQIDGITIRNTTGVGVNVTPQGSDEAIVNISNLVAENCGTNAIYTSGANARLTINGATLATDGSDHVVNLNGGPMALNDVTINGANLAAGKYELYSGAGWLTIGGAMDANVYIATGRVVKVNKELTGNNLVIDWKTAPTDAALEFSSAALMEASMDNITLGSTQTAAGNLLYTYTANNKGYAKLVSGVVTTESQLNDYLQAAAARGMANVTVRIGASFEVASQVTIPATITNLTILDDGDTATTNTVTYTGSTDGLFVMHSGLNLTVNDISLASTQKALLKQTAGTTELNGVNLSGKTNNIYVTAGTMTVNGGQIAKSTADSIKSEGTGMVALNGVTVLGSNANGVVAINGGKISITDSTVTGGGHSVLAQDGEVTLSNVTIRNSTNSGIRANKTTSVVNATDVTIEGSAKGLSVQYGTVSVTNLTIRNTTGIGVSVESADVANGTNVTINNLVAENCGTNAIKTSGANANLFVNGATLGGDGSDHVIDLNGGPLTLHDVTISGANLATGKYELYSGAGWLTIGGAMDANVYIATGRVVKVNKELTGNNLVVDWKTAPTDAALEFSSAALMEASMDNITLGSTQTAAGNLLYTYTANNKGYAKLVNCVVTNETQLKNLLTGMAEQGYADVTVLIGGSFDVANQVAVPATITNLTIKDDGNTATTNAVNFTANVEGMFNVGNGLKMTVQNISLTSTKNVLLKQSGGELVVDNCVLDGANKNILQNGGTLTVRNTDLKRTTSNNVTINANLTLEGDVLIEAPTGAENVHGLYFNKGNITINGNVTVNGAKGSSIQCGNDTRLTISETATVNINGGGRAGLLVGHQATVTVMGELNIANTTGPAIYVGYWSNGACSLTIANGGSVTVGADANGMGIDNVGIKIQYTGTLDVQSGGSLSVSDTNEENIVLQDSGVLKLAGNVNASILSKSRPIEVTGVLTGNLLLDWTTAPSGAGITFASEAVMNAFKNAIAGGQIRIPSYYWPEYSTTEPWQAILWERS